MFLKLAPKKKHENSIMRLGWIHKMQVWNEITMHNPIKKAINANWSQNGA